MISAEVRPRIDTGLSVNPYIDEMGRKAKFASRSDTSKARWARQSGMETINGGLELAASRAEDSMDRLLGVRGVEPYNYLNLGLPYHLHVARHKAMGVLKGYEENRPEHYYGERFAVGDCTLRIRDRLGDDILNKPENPQAVAEIARRLYHGIQEGAELSYDAGVAVGVLGVTQDVRLCTVHSSLGTLRQDLPMERLLALIAHPDFAGCTGGLDVMELFKRDFIIPNQHITTMVTEWDVQEVSPIGEVVPAYASLEEDPTHPQIQVITQAAPGCYSTTEVAPELAVNAVTLGCIARGFVPLW